MAWIESHDTLARHPKTRRFARALSISVPQAIGHLHLLWWWSLEYAQDGDLSGFEPLELADAAMWEGEATAFVDALTRAGFLEMGEDDTLLIHDWEDYAGKLLQRREANRTRQETYRNRHKPQGPPPKGGNTVDMLPSRNDDVTVMSPSRNGATVPYSTVPNLDIHTRAREAADPMLTTDASPEVKRAQQLTPVKATVVDSFDNIPAAGASTHSDQERAAVTGLFIQTYPLRNGILTDTPDDIGLAFMHIGRDAYYEVIRGAENYAASAEAQRGIVMGAVKWLLSKQWQRWQVPEQPKPTTGGTTRGHYESKGERAARNLRLLAEECAPEAEDDQGANHQESSRLLA